MILILLVGCGSSGLGPRIMPNERQAFNVALKDSDDEQLLINLVRMRYGDRPCFLGIESISAQNELDTGTIASWQSTDYHTSNSLLSPLTTAFTITPAVSYQQRPTIFYTPLQGEKFTRQILTPVRLENMALLVESGWSIARVLIIGSQSLGDFPNAPDSARPDSKHLPEYKAFAEIAFTIRGLQRENVLHLEQGKIGNVPTLDLVLNPRTTQAKARWQKLLALLKINSSYDKIRIVQAHVLSKHAIQGTNILPIVTRSFLGAMYFLSKSVEVSPQDIASGEATVARYPNGKIFDWRNITTGMMRIYSTSNLSKRATVATHYRNRWYYIAENDEDSKETLALIELMFALQSGELTGRSPLVTIRA